MSSPADRLASVLDRFERPLIGYAYVRCGDYGTAQDAVQETLLRFLRQGPTGEVESLAPWLFTTCRHILTDLYRKARRQPPTDLLTDDLHGDVLSSAPSPDEMLTEKETAGELRRLIAALPQIQQEVVRLKFETGLSYRDIAAATGLSIANVGWLLHQAVTTLRHDWHRHEAVGSLPFATC